MSQAVLVTGGAGFIGSHLCKKLVTEGYSVISLDNYFTGSKANHVPGVEYREGHTKDIATLIPEDVDVIFHLGEYSRVARSLREPEKVLDLNMVGTAAVVEYWRSKKCKLIYAGSSTKFADERADGIGGRDRSPYSWAKAANSELVHNYGRWYELPYSIAYFYNVYGPGERADWKDGYGTVIEVFKQCYQEEKPCPVNGDGTQTRAFTHVYDTVDALLCIMKKGECDEYAISAQETYSLLDVVALFGLVPEFHPATPSTRSSGASDTTKLRSLGWKQQYTLEGYIEAIKKDHA